MTGNQSTVENAKEKLDRWLKDGITTPGGKLPSERELGELLGIKRMTLRQALLNLEAESKIFRKDRKGWFVTQPRFNYGPQLSKDESLPGGLPRKTVPAIFPRRSRH